MGHGQPEPGRRHRQYCPRRRQQRHRVPPWRLRCRFHAIAKPGSGYTEHVLLPSHITFNILLTMSLEEAATILQAAMTAAVLLYSALEVPQPWAKPTGKMPLVIYGAASAVGAYSVQLARRSGIHLLICVVGRGWSLLRVLWIRVPVTLCRIIGRGVSSWSKISARRSRRARICCLRSMPCRGRGSMGIFTRR
jgi:hypothetical protein